MAGTSSARTAAVAEVSAGAGKGPAKAVGGGARVGASEGAPAGDVGVMVSPQPAAASIATTAKKRVNTPA